MYYIHKFYLESNEIDQFCLDIGTSFACTQGGSDQTSKDFIFIFTYSFRPTLSLLQPFAKTFIRSSLCAFLIVLCWPGLYNIYLLTKVILNKF